MAAFKFLALLGLLFVTFASASTWVSVPVESVVPTTTTFMDASRTVPGVPLSNSGLTTQTSTPMGIPLMPHVPCMSWNTWAPCMASADGYTGQTSMPIASPSGGLSSAHQTGISFLARTSVAEPSDKMMPIQMPIQIPRLRPQRPISPYPKPIETMNSTLTVSQITEPANTTSVVGTSTIASGNETTPTGAPSSPATQTTGSPGPSTVVLTRTLSHSTGATASASDTTGPGLVNSAGKVAGGLTMGLAVSISVLFFGY